VEQTAERAIVDDAPNDPRCASDPYVLRAKPRSILCLPIRRQAELVAMLYLENNLVAQAFTPERLVALELLAAQAAISLENALLLDKERRSREAAEASREAAEVAERRLAFLAHELKSPITTIGLKLSALARKSTRAKEVDASSFASALAMINRQFERLTVLVDSLLDLSRIQRGRLVLSKERIDLAALAKEVTERMAETALLAKCALRLEANQPVWGDWDRLRLEQVVTNLLSNAFKYAAGTPVQIVVDSDGINARLSVSDRGIGIPEADRQRIFEPFERATGLQQKPGLGLGLYLVQEIVRAHGGRVDVHSDAGRGSTFVVHLPIQAGCTVVAESA
jgi:signal transduction histidine kinase